MPIAHGARSPRVRALGAALRKAREEHGISNRELAARLSIDQSHLSRIETGKKTPSVETTAMILAALRIPPAERERILELARNAGEPNWLTVGIPGIPQQLAGAWECERAAVAITAWNLSLIPGLLQTTDYSKSIFQAELDDRSESEIESRVVIKTSRREVLGKRDRPSYTALIGESALREPIGPHEVMVEQLRHLIKMSEQSNVSIRVVPQHVGWHPGLVGSFVFYEFHDGPPVVHFEHHSSGVFDQDEDDIRAYRRAIEKLNQLALSQRESAQLVAQIIVDKWDSR